jgi:hypothetical protein
MLSNVTFFNVAGGHNLNASDAWKAQVGSFLRQFDTTGTTPPGFCETDGMDKTGRTTRPAPERFVFVFAMLITMLCLY